MYQSLRFISTNYSAKHFKAAFIKILYKYGPPTQDYHQPLLSSTELFRNFQSFLFYLKSTECFDGRCLPNQHKSPLTLGFTLYESSGLLGKSPVHVWPNHPFPTFSLLILLCLTSSFAVVISTTTTRGHNLIRNTNMGLNKQLSKWTYIVFPDEDKLVNLLFQFITTALISGTFRCNRQLLSVKELQKKKKKYTLPAP